MPRGVRNVSHYEDMQELLVASDCVISDYSSVSCEFAFQERPVFLYMPDIIEYSKKRSFRFDFESLPYPLAKNENELIMRIEQFDNETYLERLREFHKDMGFVSFDGKASYRCAKHILSWIEGS